MAVLIQEQEGRAGIRVRLDKPVFTIGRDPGCDLSLDDELVSKHHATIEAVEDPEHPGRFQYYVQDQDSTNHTYVNGERVGLCRLSQDDVIDIGLSSFRFVDDAHDDLEETTRIQRTWIPGLYVARRKTRKKKAKRKKRTRSRKS